LLAIRRSVAIACSAGFALENLSAFDAKKSDQDQGNADQGERTQEAKYNSQTQKKQPADQSNVAFSNGFGLHVAAAKLAFRYVFHFS
jgi:hypothetical protein